MSCSKTNNFVRFRVRVMLRVRVMVRSAWAKSKGMKALGHDLLGQEDRDPTCKVVVLWYGNFSSGITVFNQSLKM